jgi:hypothetical protein
MTLFETAYTSGPKKSIELGRNSTMHFHYQARKSSLAAGFRKAAGAGLGFGQLAGQ